MGEPSKFPVEEDRPRHTAEIGRVGILTMTVGWIGGAARPADAASAAEIRRNVDAATPSLMRLPLAKQIVPKAKAVLIFPKIIKGGFIVGGQYGEGALRKGKKTVGTTTRWRRRTACRPACRSSATPSSS